VGRRVVDTEHYGGYGDVEDDVGGLPAVTDLDSEPSLSFADESRGAAGGSLATREMVRGEQKRAGRRFFALSDGCCQDFSLCTTPWWELISNALCRISSREMNCGSAASHSCNFLVNVLDTGPTLPREEELLDDDRGAPEPMQTDAFVSEKSVSHVAAQ
jgi:hypothetical protein